MAPTWDVPVLFFEMKCMATDCASKHNTHLTNFGLVVRRRGGRHVAGDRDSDWHHGH